MLNYKSRRGVMINAIETDSEDDYPIQQNKGTHTTNLPRSNRFSSRQKIVDPSLLSDESDFSDRETAKETRRTDKNSINLYMQAKSTANPSNVSPLVNTLFDSDTDGGVPLDWAKTTHQSVETRRKVTVVIAKPTLQPSPVVFSTSQPCFSSSLFDGDDDTPAKPTFGAK